MLQSRNSGTWGETLHSALKVRRFARSGFNHCNSEFCYYKCFLSKSDILFSGKNAKRNPEGMKIKEKKKRKKIISIFLNFQLQYFLVMASKAVNRQQAPVCSGRNTVPIFLSHFIAGKIIRCSCWFLHWG